MEKETWRSLHDLQKKYSKYGVTLTELIGLMKSAPPDVSERAALLGIRLMLGKTFNVTEFFTVDDVSEITGESTNEVKERIKTMGIDYTKITIPFIDL